MALNFQDRKIEDNFEKISFTEAKCKTCSSTFIHTYLDEFRKHIDKTHKFDIDTKEKYLQSCSLWKYIRYNREEPGFQCALCKENVELYSENSTHHIHERDEYTSMRTYYEEWQLKYCEMQQENDSEIKCYICQDEIKIDFRRDILMYHIREYHSEHPPQNVKDIAALITSEEIWHKFINFSNVKAECRTCNCIIQHTEIPKFYNHMEEIHKDVVEFEKETKEIDIEKPLRKYIKYCENGNWQCVLCEDQVTNKNDYVNHIHADDKFTSMGKHYKEEWVLKYCKRTTNESMECNICKSVLAVSFNETNLTAHIKSCQDDISLKLQNINMLWSHYRKLSQYYNRVECKHCNKYIENYINSSHLRNHLNDEHKHIICFQKENSEYEMSCRNLKLLKYLKKPYYECDICHQAVSIETLLSHGCKDDHKNTMVTGLYDDWIWKYFVHMDFVVKCVLCLDTFDIDFQIIDLMSHINNDCPEIKQKTYGIKSHEATTTLKRCGPILITTEVWPYFEKNDKISLSKARCTLCTQSEELFNYVHIKLFSSHVKKHHPEIFQFETQEFVNKYVKYMYGVCTNFYHCVVCDIDIILDKRQLNDHIHKDEKLNHYLYYDDWSWKYCTKVNELSVKCINCSKEISIEYDTSLLRNHLRTNHKFIQKSYLKRTYENIADPKAGTLGTQLKQQKYD